MGVGTRGRGTLGPGFVLTAKFWPGSSLVVRKVPGYLLDPAVQLPNAVGLSDQQVPPLAGRPN
jgi:hypothetical protein